MKRNHENSQEKRSSKRGLRLSIVAASAVVVAGGVLLPATGAMAAGMPESQR
ncbi:hypothetical protein [Streptomyces amritsarensis]|uniref:hypothetical protein n=1 Tax=Streptomyces amritsarensis TaxID=681158 RepID=UPI00367EDA5A